MVPSSAISFNCFQSFLISFLMISLCTPAFFRLGLATETGLSVHLTIEQAGSGRDVESHVEWLISFDKFEYFNYQYCCKL